MLNVFARVHVNRVTEPIGRWLLARGLTPDAVTVIGIVGAVAGAVILFPLGQLFWGTIVVTLFVLLDLVDGAMARVRGHSTPFGAVLDSTGDRLVDGAVFGALAWWCLTVADLPAVGAATLICLVTGQVVSYVKARADAAGLSADGGFVERAERLLLGLAGTGLTGLGVPYALHVALWLLAVGSVLTLGQRFVALRRSARAAT